MTELTNITPIVTVKEGVVVATSRDVAEFFGKRHDNVLRDIDALISEDPSNALNFEGIEIEVAAGFGTRKDRAFQMDRDGFTLLAMGFTGKKAMAFKKLYIKRFNEMEAELRRVAENAPALNLNDPAALRGLLLDYTERAIELQNKVDELMPSHDALQRIAVADGSFCITDAAKALQMRPRDLFDWLSHNGWIYKRTGSTYWLGFASKCNAGLLEHKTTTVLRADGSEKVTEQVRITALGLTKLAKLIKPIASAA